MGPWGRRVRHNRVTITHSLKPKNNLSVILESPLDCKKIQPVHPKGDQSWVFIGRTDAEAETPILWPPYWKRP